MMKGPRGRPWPLRVCNELVVHGLRRIPRRHRVATAVAGAAGAAGTGGGDAGGRDALLELLDGQLDGLHGLPPKMRCDESGGLAKPPRRSSRLPAARLGLRPRTVGDFSAVTVAVALPGPGRPPDGVGGDALLELVERQLVGFH